MAQGCEQCDFDLCDLCFQRHIGQVNNSIENLKTSSMELHSEGSDPLTNTVWLFHGTNDEAAELITKGDFLVDKAGSNAPSTEGVSTWQKAVVSPTSTRKRIQGDFAAC